MNTDFQEQIDGLWAAVRRLEQNAAERAAVLGASGVRRIEIIVPKDASLGQSSLRDAAEVPDKVEAAIKATLSALLGQEVRIRSVTPLERADTPSSWAQQGRVAQQSSHNQRTTRD